MTRSSITRNVNCRCGDLSWGHLPHCEYGQAVRAAADQAPPLTIEQIDHILAVIHNTRP